MFAFALWDRGNRSLYLVRDRLGEKPLYYGWVGKSLAFASELKGLREHPDWRTDICRDALSVFMRHSYVPSPHTIYEGIYKLPPGTFVRFGPDEKVGYLPEPFLYWSARDVAEDGCRNPINASEDEIVTQLDQLLKTSVKEKMISDVPLGAFLSGGIDSSTVVALMQNQSDRPIRTFSIGFHEKGYNEAEHAKSIAAHLGTEHTELYVTSKEAMEVIPKLPDLYDEPFSDSSQIPTHLVSAMTRKHVTVSLSGDGGDELFGGYHRYFVGGRMWNRMRFMPRSVRKTIASLIRAVPAKSWNKMGAQFSAVLPRELGVDRTGERLHKIANVLGVSSPEMLYRGLVSHWDNPSSIVINGDEPQTVLSDRKQWARVGNYIQWMMHMDLVSYLPDDILVKVDRASMGVGLEARVPFIDHRVVEFAWHLPLRMKIRNGQGKWILRQILDKYVPRQMMERPKMGFGVPIDSWLRGELRDWVEDLLDEDRLRREGYLHPGPIREKWRDHLSGKRNWQYYLWDVLMFQAWLQRYAA